MTNNSCNKQIAYDGACNEAWPDDQCQTDNAQCLKLGEQIHSKCQCNQTFFYKDPSCVKRNDYNVADLNFQIPSEQIHETTATLAWRITQDTHPFWSFLAVIQNQTGDEVSNYEIYYASGPSMDRSTLLQGFEPGHHYSVLIHVNMGGTPSIRNATLGFCTRPLGVASINLENITESTFSIAWDYETSNVFSNLVVKLSPSIPSPPTQKIPDDAFVNCPDQQDGVCTLTRNDSVKYLHVHNLTPGTQYNVSIYTSACNSSAHSVENQTSSYTVPSLPKFTVEDSGEGITASSVKVKWEDKDGTKAAQFQEWHAVVKDMFSTFIKNETFRNDVFEGTIKGLSSATSYTIGFYTTVPGQQSSTSTPVQFYTRPPAVVAASISVSGTTTNSLTIQWSAPTMGDVRNYQYNGTFTCTSPNDDRETATQPLLLTNQSTATATKLDPGANCSVDILTLVGGLVSDYSYTTLTQKTNEAAPEQVRNLQVSSQAATSVAVVWKDPSKRNGVIRRYEIRIPRYKPDTCEPGSPTEEKGIECYRKIPLVCSDCASDGQISPTTPPHKGFQACGDSEAGGSFNKGQRDFSHTIAGLHAYMNYSIVIAAYTFIRGKDAINTVVTAESMPGVVTSVSVTPEGDVTKERAITVAWAPPKRGDRNGVITGYVINVVTFGIDVNCTTNASTTDSATCPSPLIISCTMEKANVDSKWTCELSSIATGEYTVTVFAKSSVGAGSPTRTPVTVEPGAPISISGAAGDPSIVQPFGTSVYIGDPKRQIAVQFPRSVICNDDQGAPSFWGIVVAEESMATDTPFTGTLADFNTVRIRNTYKTWFQVEGSDNMAPYIATTKTWNPCQALKGSRRKRSAASDNVGLFVVGESGTCPGTPSGDRCNGALVPHKSYRVKVFVCTDGGCAETKYSSPISTMPFPTISKDKPFPVAIVSMVVSATVVLIIAVVIIVFMKRRQMFCFGDGKYVDEESIHRLGPPVSSSEMKNIPVTNNSHVFKPGPVRLIEFPAYVDRLHRDSNRMFSEAYTMLKAECPVHSMTVAKEQRNKQKNRYINILAYDHSRVQLLPMNEGGQSDYINASYIPSYSSARGYIAAQGPLVSTINDFWRMVWEQNVDTIVMLSKPGEKGRHKSDTYWPGRKESGHYGDVVVCVQSVSHMSDYTIRVMEVKLMSSRRLVHHFCYLGWPETEGLDNPTQMLEFVKSVQEHTNCTSSKKAPMLVHCGTGVGRTGTFIAVDYLMKYIRDHDDIDIYKLVLEMRNYRCTMVQTEDQYAFIHDCLKELTTLDGAEYETHYQSLCPTGRTPEHVYASPDYNTEL